MGVAMFYQLQEKTLVDTLRMLVDKSLSAGWRVAVRGTNPMGLEALDKALWLGPEDGFLPHGLQGGDHDAAQPVLLGQSSENLNNASCIMAVHSADVSADDVTGMERVCIIFDGYDEDELTHARGQWKALKAAGVSAQYWAEDGGRWVKKAES
ncbi:DNA polymerase III subunit chi [Sulfitobacter donghicola]|uniref:DNA polymerase III subunit chi n=1 Tax=Sulfitobacter donghicola DSW-25 = KCTC 12864 = JCM 14565 TaxID=1300350 RepID=A0A073IJC3_9RHOB|nr:DNA polymerase III subunit chi [Sulfitobacter donghicola]KEJ89596.1 DNA polymerase III subunit chi [Sulfitobacter donghicola DSW-25 = KCTC 12864 = JCM 14565]KIN69433.1 DNA polymerase III subunit chi [Sulfitobacter donghicola DSW-25 = KCTC 12864 = JCM 14565]